MRNWQSFYEILKYPIEVLFIAWIMIGIGNLLSNGSLGIVYSIENDMIIVLAEMLVKAGQFLVVNFPFIFLIRLSARQTGSAICINSFISTDNCRNRLLTAIARAALQSLKMHCMGLSSFWIRMRSRNCFIRLIICAAFSFCWKG